MKTNRKTGTTFRQNVLVTSLSQLVSGYIFYVYLPDMMMQPSWSVSTSGGPSPPQGYDGGSIPAPHTPTTGVTPVIPFNLPPFDL